jgi:MarR-like DNA-binding transcriptional regulator SgrR of sgrS sRNA
MTFKAFVAHGQGRPYLDEVALESYPTRVALTGALARGRIDAALGLTPEGSAFERSAALLLLVLDPRRAPFDRPAARAALAARLAAHVAGLARLVAGQRARGLLSPALAWPAFESDATGTQGLPLPGHVRLAVARDVPALASQHVAALLADAGLQVDVQPGEARAAPAEARLLLFVPEVAEVGLVLEELAALGTPIPALEAWLAQARRETNADARRALLLKAESALRAERVLLPLLDLPTDFVASPDLFDAQVDAAGYLRLADAWRRP